MIEIVSPDVAAIPSGQLIVESPHATPAGAVAAALGVDPRAGLTSDEARRRATLVGPNELDPSPHTSLPRLVLEAVTEPFVVLLIVAGVLAVLLGEVRDGLLVLLALLPIVGADVITEYRGERALEALREATAPIAHVRRDGAVEAVSASTIVPGDIVLLRGGDVVPADLRLLRVDRLQVDRSVLTGESVPEMARIEPVAASAPLPDRTPIAYAATSVVAGRGEGVVVATGATSEVGRIAGGLGVVERRRSPLQAELDRLVRILLVVAIALIAIVTTLGFVRGQDAGANILAGVSAAIAAVPEEPPVLLAVILGLGAYRLLRRKVLVRRLNAEETLGAIDLIVTDKTGTLTRNRLEVVSVTDLAGPVVGTRHLDVLLQALRAEDDAWVRADGAVPGSFTRSLERAIEATGQDHALDPSALIESEPVDDARPFSRTRARVGGTELIEELAIGAPEAVLALAGASPVERAGWLDLVDVRAAAGERLVAVAHRPDGGSWAVVALVGFADPLREGIAEALAYARAAGIEVIVVTGDHPATAAAIAEQAGLDPRRIVVGETVGSWDDERLAAEISKLQIVARSTPEAKERLVRIARQQGRTVVVTGDGVNDAPALHRADVAVAMGSGTGVAKEAADLVLGDDSFATLMYGLREGRRIVDNVQKGLIFLISTHVAFLGFILIATIYGFGQPLLPLQILWMELFIDISTSAAFELEKAEPDLMTRRPRDRTVPLLTNDLLGRIAVAGSYSAIAALLVMVTHPGTAEHARWLAYTSLVCAQAVRANANRSVREPIHRLAVNWFLLAAGLGVVAIQAAIPFVPFLAEAFHATPLDASDWVVVAVIALVPAIVAEVVRTVTGRTWVA